MRRLASVLAVVVLAGCGGSSSDSQRTATTSPSKSSAGSSAPSMTEAKVFVETRAVPQYRAALRKRGAGTFGDTSVECAATGGPRTECRVSIDYMRLSECAQAKGTVFVVDRGDGPQAAGGTLGGLDLTGQVCYIGPDGNPVPSKP